MNRTKYATKSSNGNATRLKLQAKLEAAPKGLSGDTGQSQSWHMATDFGTNPSAGLLCAA